MVSGKNRRRLSCLCSSGLTFEAKKISGKSSLERHSERCEAIKWKAKRDVKFSRCDCPRWATLAGLDLENRLIIHGQNLTTLQIRPEPFYEIRGGPIINDIIENYIHDV